MPDEHAQKCTAQRSSKDIKDAPKKEGQYINADGKAEYVVSTHLKEEIFQELGLATVDAAVTREFQDRWENACYFRTTYKRARGEKVAPKLFSSRTGCNKATR